MRRIVVPITILLLLPLLPGMLAAQTPAPSPVDVAGGWRIAGVRELDLGTRAPTLSPDGRWLAGAGPEGTFCVWDVETQTPACTGENLPIREETVVWAPDGSAVAFALDTIRELWESDIYVYEVDTGELKNLTDDGHEGGLLDLTDIDPPIDDTPAWSPDGQQVAFARSRFGADEPGSTAIMRIDRAGGEPVEIISLDAEEPVVVWSPMHWLPDDTLVYSRLSLETEDARNGVWAVGIDGGSPRQVAPGAADTDIPGSVIVDVDAERGQAIVLAWSLAGQRGLDADQPLYWLVDLASGERAPLPALPAAGDRAPATIGAGYSPDGGTILLVTVGDEGLMLATMDPETLAVTPVAGEPIQAAPMPGATLQWAIDDTVALHAPQGAIVVDLVPAGDAAVASPAASPEPSPVAGGVGWQVTDLRELGIESRYVALSPDGQWLAGVGPEDTLCVWDVATLTPACADERLPIRAETITWSPDSTAVAFALDTIRLLYESDIYVYERETGVLSNLTDDGIEGDLLDNLDRDAPADDVPTWSPDSQRLAFVRSYTGVDDAPGSTAIMRIDRAGGEPVDVLPLDVEQPFAVWMPMSWLADGTLVYSQIAPDLSDPGNGVWKVGVDDGSSPLQIVPGSETAEVPGPMVSDIADGKAIVYSYWLMGQFTFEADQPLFWLIDVATGDRTPLEAPTGTESEPSWIVDGAFSPDGATMLFITRSSEGAQLMTMDVATGEVVVLDADVREMALSTGAPQWAANDTVLLQRMEGPVLVTLAPTG